MTRGSTSPSSALQIRAAISRGFEPGAALPEGHPAAGKEAVGGKATVYVCEGPVCSLPITDPAALEADLRRRR